MSVSFGVLQASLLEPSPHWLGIHGDAGALLSVGLLRRLVWRSFEACVNNITFFGETPRSVCQLRCFVLRMGVRLTCNCLQDFAQQRRACVHILAQEQTLAPGCACSHPVASLPSVLY
jgi:hypothetical protein